MKKKINLTFQGQVVEIIENVVRELGHPVNKTWLVEYIIRYHLRSFINTNRVGIISFCRTKHNGGDFLDKQVIYYKDRVECLEDENKILKDKLAKLKDVIN